jgi:hypothetical protein
MAQGYIGKYNSVEPMGFEFIHNFGPAGALTAAAEDMARFIIAHVEGGAYGDARILRPETVQLMHTRLFAHDPRVAGMAHGFYEIRRNGVRFVGHAGDTIAFHSELVIHPETGFGLFLSFNTPDGARARAGVVDAVLDYFYPGDSAAPAPVSAELLAGSAERIASLAGAYRINRRSFTRLESVGGLAGDLNITPGPEGEILVPGEGIGGRFVEVEPFVFRQRGRQETLVFQTTETGRVTRAFIGSLPIMVADKLAFWETAANHQVVIGLALLAAVFVLINAIRNRSQTSPGGAARIARASLVTSSVCYLAFSVGLAVVFGGADMNRMIFDFPPAGTGLILWLPLLGALSTLVGLGMLVPVWRAADCNFWQRLRFSYVSVVFFLLVLVFGYWNLLGWRY